MEFIEYPKALYRGEEFTTAASKDDEDRLRADGWHLHGEESADNDDADKEAEADKAALLERAKALGIDAKGNWGIPRLTKAIADKEAEAQ